MNSTNLSILNFIVHLTELQSYQSLVFISSPDRSVPFEDAGRSIIEDLATTTAIPIISLTYSSSANLSWFFDRELLTIVDLQSELYPSILENVTFLLNYTTSSRIVLVLDQDEPHSDPTGLLWDIFDTCWRWKLINIVAVFRDFSVSQDIFSYDPYPTFHVERKSSSVGEIFPDRVKDMKGASLRVFADQIPPTNMLAMKQDGSVGVYGYGGHIIDCFFMKHNAVMDFALPYTIGKSVLYIGLRYLLFNDSLDMLISMVLFDERSWLYTYTVDQTSFCMMVPVEENLPTRKFYAIIVHRGVLGMILATSVILSTLLVVAAKRLDPRRSIKLSDILLNDSCLRGILWQPFNALRKSTQLMKFIYILMFVLGVYFTTWYLAYLQAYLTHPPPKHKVEQTSDLRKVGIKVNFFLLEYYRAEDIILEMVDPRSIALTESFAEYLRLVDSLDRRYAFVVPTSKWNIIKGQQELFSKPLFRLTKVCGLQAMQLAFPLHANSVHKNALNKVIFQVQESGLLSYWIGRSFYELVQIRRMNFSDWSKPDQGIGGLKVDDLACVLLFFVVAQVASVVVFAIEVVVGRRRRNRNNLSKRG